jgi:sec-independent protein translocase protein TatA
MGSGLLSPLHIALVLLIVLLVFGTRRLPELGRSLGSGMREFKHSLETGERPAGDDKH